MCSRSLSWFPWIPYFPSRDQANLKGPQKDPRERPNKGVLPIVLDHGEARGSNQQKRMGWFPWISI